MSDSVPSKESNPNLAWIDGTRFDAEVLEAAGRVVVLFWAAWSGPDRMLLTWLRDHAADWPGVKFAVLNVDEHSDVAVRFHYVNMPTTLAFEGGELVGRLEGLPGYDRDRWGRAFDELAGQSGTDAAG